MVMKFFVVHNYKNTTVCKIFVDGQIVLGAVRGVSEYACVGEGEKVLPCG